MSVCNIGWNKNKEVSCRRSGDMSITVFSLGMRKWRKKQKGIALMLITLSRSAKIKLPYVFGPWSKVSGLEFFSTNRPMVGGYMTFTLSLGSADWQRWMRRFFPLGCQHFWNPTWWLWVRHPCGDSKNTESQFESCFWVTYSSALCDLGLVQGVEWLVGSSLWRVGLYWSLLWQ